MQIANRVGFTIVELLIGVSAAAILAVAAGVLLESAFRGSARAKAAVEMEQDASVAIHTIELAIRSASNTVTGEVGVDRLKVRTPSGVIRASQSKPVMDVGVCSTIRMTPAGHRWCWWIGGWGHLYPPPRERWCVCR